jgi:DNA (cytosine-5)-methyltransferase 1
MNHAELLKEIYNSALTLTSLDLSEEYQSLIEVIANNALNQKGVYTVLVTLLTHKIIAPNQDVRLHQKSMENGFSGRTIDTKHITPTLRELGLPCMAESGWLTRSLEQPYPYNFDYSGKIGEPIKNAFLCILDYIEKNPNKAKPVLAYLLFCVIQKNKTNTVLITKIDDADTITIDSIIAFLEASFTYNYKKFGGSKLPVIAFHCIFQQLIDELKRYEGCTLNKLGSHTASDRTSKTAGDIEIFKNGELIEAIEIKLDKPINSDLMRQIQQKIYKHNPKRYCVFSSGHVIEADAVKNIVNEIKENHGCQVIVNGVIPTLKYYLRLIMSLQYFINSFLIAVENDLELKPIHRTVIVELIEKYFKSKIKHIINHQTHR